MKDGFPELDRQAYRRYEESLEQLKSSLTPCQCDLLTEFINAAAVLQSFSAINQRICGFQDGVKLREELEIKGINSNIDE